MNLYRFYKYNLGGGGAVQFSAFPSISGNPALDMAMMYMALENQKIKKACRKKLTEMVQHDLAIIGNKPLNEVDDSKLELLWINPNWSDSEYKKAIELFKRVPNDPIRNPKFSQKGEASAYQAGTPFLKKVMYNHMIFFELKKKGNDYIVKYVTIEG